MLIFPSPYLLESIQEKIFRLSVQIIRMACNVFYATLAVQMKLQKGIEMDRKAVISGFFFTKFKKNV